MSRPPIDFDKLGTALRAQGVPLEAEAYFACRRHDWNCIHAYRYGEPPDTREVDVLAYKTIDFLDDGGSKPRLSGGVVLLIECKFATQWWVFVDLSDNTASPGDLVATAQGVGIAPRLSTFVVSALRKEQPDFFDPPRTGSTRERSFDYKTAQRAQFYPASQQALSAMRGSHFYELDPFSLQHPHLWLLAPAVMTNRPLIIARAREGSEDFEF